MAVKMELKTAVIRCYHCGEVSEYVLDHNDLAGFPRTNFAGDTVVCEVDCHHCGETIQAIRKFEGIKRWE